MTKNLMSLIYWMLHLLNIELIRLILGDYYYLFYTWLFDFTTIKRFYI